ncbi:MAG: DUF6430 domain-containing protein [Defluviitaleaceae bacterium]|nr:DUF6430 domain-containing protein [Defluviitaleaceae bacterium]
MKDRKKHILNRIKCSFIRALKRTWVYLVLISSIATIIGIVGFEHILEEITERVILVVIIVCVAFLFAFFVEFFKRKININLGNGRLGIIKYGYLFSERNKGVIIVPFNRYFDTLVNGAVISEKSIAGQFIKEKFAGNSEELNGLIADQLKDATFNTISNKRNGKKDKYDIGKVVKISKDGNDYFCVATTDVDIESNKSKADIDMLHVSLSILLKTIDEEANGRDVYMPVLGTGFSRLGKDKQTILEYIIAFFRANDDKLKSKLHIILLESECELFDLSKIRVKMEN